MSLETLHVDEEGKVCVRCLDCGFYKIKKAPENKQKIYIKCGKCGSISPFNINWRKNPRKEYEKNFLIGKREAKIKDISMGGISFFIKKPYNIPLFINEIKIILPVNTPKGEIIFQPVKAQIVSRCDEGEYLRYGCKFLDFNQSSKGYKELGFWLRS